MSPHIYAALLLLDRAAVGSLESEVRSQPFSGWLTRLRGFRFTGWGRSQANRPLIPTVKYTP